ncbi:FecCD family ABC transporter permease [Cohnella silvisoli]|uniref:Iron ABC transporter permease n=1 Tax=Cohnella silvisoli TaxID=2873699 RepID=A0ABV1KYL1_9BACL|nr:iron ABC transporter permease [Cohnella silvisoli]MCD9024444.1 iron ABC transporter permease [Cohnella silvisoli]
MNAPYTNRKDPRSKTRYALLALFAVLLLLSILYGLMVGAVSIPAKEVWTSLINDTDSEFRQIVWNLRLPRVLTGLLVGICLAVSGAFLQGVFRNPLADPGIIGVSSGAGLAAVSVMILFPEQMSLVPLAAFLGALAAAAIIYALAWNKGAPAGRMILAGVAVNSLLGAGMTTVILLNSEKVQAVLPWLAGSLNGKSWPHFETILPYACIGMVLSVFLVKHANVLILGDEVAKLLGNRVERSRMLVILMSTFMAGIAISVSGLIGFVGLVVPHIVRMIAGNDYKFFLPLSALGGGALVVAADTSARAWFDPIEFPVGVLLALLGAPFFLYLLRGGLKGWKTS